MSALSYGTIDYINVGGFHIDRNKSFYSYKLIFRHVLFQSYDDTVIEFYIDDPSKLVCYVDHKIGLDGVEE